LPHNGIDYIPEVYEPEVIKLLETTLKKGDIFLDIGGGIGYFSIIASKLVGETGKVYAFEPDPFYTKFFKKNIQVNACKNVTLIEKAVSDKNSNSILYRYQRTGQNRIAEVGEKTNNFCQIETIRIDDNYSGRVDLIKMDIEGAEILALEGMKNLLEKNPNVKMVIEESSELIDYLKKNNYQITKIDDRNLEVNK